MRRITQRTANELRPPANGSRIVWDGEIPGLGVRVTASGVVSFVLAYRIHGRQTKYTLGRSPEWSVTAARNEAIELRKRVRDGIDPHQERAKLRSEPTGCAAARTSAAECGRQEGRGTHAPLGRRGAQARR